MKNTLRIYFFGEFRMNNSIYSFPHGRKKSKQLILLIAYLIINKGKICFEDDLMKILWPEEDSTNAKGALRNLVYRARKELQGFNPGKNNEYIISKGNGYAWNFSTDCEIDIFHMEELCNQIDKTDDPDLLFHLCHRLADKYDLEFLSDFQGQEWIEVLKLYYKNLFEKSFVKICDTLIKNKRYNEVIDICNVIGVESYTNDRIHEYKLKAYYHTGQFISGLKYYHRINGMYNLKFFIDVNSSCRQIYQKILDRMKQQSVNIKELKRLLDEGNKQEGAYFCSFDIFLNLFQFYIRSRNLFNQHIYLVLLSLEYDENYNRMLEKDFMILKDTLKIHLRDYDVFTQCESCRYAILMITNTEKECKSILDNIGSKFNENKLEKTILHKEYKRIDHPIR